MARQFNVNQATLEGFAQQFRRNHRRPFFNRFGWTQGIDFFCNCADNRYDSLQTKVTKRFSNGYSILAHYTLQRSLQDSGEHFFFDASLNRGAAGLGPHSQLRLLAGLGAALRQGQDGFSATSRGG